jgi:predicted MFS family arabinose efflux permease
MLPLFGAVFIDLFSFGLMYPVIVALFEQPAIADRYPPDLRGLYLSLAFSLFPLGNFFGASYLGDLSDVFGRRRTLMLCLAGLGASYILMLVGVASLDLAWLLAGRLLSGLMAGTAPIAQAAMMDQSSEEERGSAMSRIVLVNCVALVSGPAAGGLLGHLDFRLPLAFAIFLCVIAFFWIRYSRPDCSTGKLLRLGWRRPFEIFGKALLHPTIRRFTSAFFLFQFGFGIYYIYIQVFMTRAHGLSAAGLGLFSATIGAGFVVGTTVAYAKAKLWLHRDDRVVGFGLLTTGLFIFSAALPIPGWIEWPLAFGAAVSNVLAFVGLLTLISGAASQEEQGWAMGIGGSTMALAFFLSGLFANVLNVLPLVALLAVGGLIVLTAILPICAQMTHGSPTKTGP